MTDIALAEGPAADGIAPSTDTPAPSSPDGAADWRAAIGDPALRRAAARFASPEEAVRSWTEAQKKISRSVSLPGRDAGEAERRAFAEKHLGVPASVDGYGAAAPEGLAADEEGQARFRRFLEAAHGALATPAQVEALSAWYAQEAEGVAAEAARMRAAEDTAAVEALRRQWGRDYDANVTRARRAAEHLFGPDWGRLAEIPLAGGRMLGSLPEVVAALATLGRNLGEAEFASAGHATIPGGDESRTALDRLIEESRTAGTYYTEPVQARVRALHEQLYSAGPAVANFGRSTGG